MHEASIVRELIALAAERAPQGWRVLSVEVSVGLLTGVSPDALQFYFEILRDASLGEQARLEARLAPLRGRCGACGASCTLVELGWLCPACGQPTLVFENGDELNLVGLTVDDGPLDHARPEDPQEERRAGPGEPGPA